MKTKFALLLALLMLFASAFALAEDSDPETPTPDENVIELDRNTMTGTTSVSLTVDRSQDTFVVVIPSSVTIDPVTQYGYGDITLKAGWELISVNNLKVKLSGAKNGIGSGKHATATTPQSLDVTLSAFQNFTLSTTDDLTTTYAIKSSNSKYPFSSVGSSSTTAAVYSATNVYTENLIRVSKGGNNETDNTCQLTFYVAKMPDNPGVYTDTLTFKVITE